jgi:hypothetical protein
MRKNKIKNKTISPAKQIPLKDIDYEELFSILNKDIPINFKKNNLLNEIHERYQLIGKDDLALVLKTIFEIIREKVIEGYKINTQFIFSEFHLIANKLQGTPFLLAKNITSPKIRKNVDHDK